MICAADVIKEKGDDLDDEEEMLLLPNGGDWSRLPSTP
tara:strand:- start:274 stop:387 length:114 start_codon:yes stop_codon:yes gene_type:complete